MQRFFILQKVEVIVMKKTVVSVGLPADESLRIYKNSLEPEQAAGSGRRLCVVTGIHGDELEGQYVCYELNRRIREQMECLWGIVDIYPALNPLGLDTITRGIPGFDLDMNRIFPGTGGGSMAEQAAAGIMEDIAGADLCIDIHASNIFLREIPQVRLIGQQDDSLLDMAKCLNVNFIWEYEADTVMESTLSHSLNAAGVPTLVVEMGVGMRITESYCRQLTDGIFCVMKKLGIWKGETIVPRTPILSRGCPLAFVNANAAGIFLPSVEHWESVKEGELLGRILHPLEGTVEESVYAPMSGMVFTLREYPVVTCGSLLARVVGGDF